MIVRLQGTGGSEFAWNTCHILESFKMGRKTAQKPWPQALSETFL